MWKKHLKEIVILTIFLIGAFAIGIASTSLNSNQTRTTSAFAASGDVDNYCRNGVYFVKNPNNTSEQISCGRGKCDGVSYEGTASIDAHSNGKCWWGDGSCGPACKGLVPLCCYKMAETGDAKDCPFPERKYCRQDQCKRQTENIDSNCGSGINTYCVQQAKCLPDKDAVPVISLEDRVAGKTNAGVIPTNTPPANTPTTVPQQATPTTRPIDTATPVPPGNNNGNNNSAPTNTPIPTATRVPISTIQPNTGGGGDFPTSIPTPTNIVETATDNKDSSSLEFAVPHIALKSPKEMVKETVTEEKLIKLNDATDPPLKIAKTTFVSVKAYDQKLENTFKDWINYLRIQLIKNFR